MKRIICLYLLLLIGGCGNSETNQIKEPVVILKEEEILASRRNAFSLCLPGTVNKTNSGQWNDYFVIMWSDPQDNEAYFYNLRKMGVNAGMLYHDNTPEVFVKHKLPFYMENITKGLYLRNTPCWQEAQEGYNKSRDTKFFIRTPCLNDPVYRQEQKALIKKLVIPCLPYKPIAYDIRDEPSITTFANPFGCGYSWTTKELL